MKFQNRVLFLINIPEVSETKLCLWKRAFMVFIWLLGFSLFVCFKNRDLFQQKLEIALFPVREECPLLLCSIHVFVKWLILQVAT